MSPGDTEVMTNPTTPTQEELARIRRMLAVEKGRATITIANEQGAHATFKVKKATGKYEGRTFVEIQDESAQYGWRSVGEVINDGRIFKPYRGCSDALNYAISITLLALGNAVSLDDVRGRAYTIQAADTCGACGRQLTHPDSIPVGIGPECSAKLGGNHPGYSSTHVRTGKKAS